MIDLSTTYMGMKLKNPLVASASPLSEKISNIRRMEDSGVAAVVHYSLFEEDVTHETIELHRSLTHGTESFAESLTYFPEPEHLFVGPHEYLEHIRKAKDAVSIPVIGSLNGYSEGGWIKYAKLIEEAGADALELNVYFVATDPEVSGRQVEETYLDILASVKSTVTIPVAVKLSPFFSAAAHMAKCLDGAGADALVLFNRFYQPDIDLEHLEVVPNVLLSVPQDLRLPLRWIAILYGRLNADLAATTGIFDHQDVLKLLMAGANATMLCSSLLRHGLEHVQAILSGLIQWMEEHEYQTVQQMRGSMSHLACANPSAFERVHYMRALRGYHF